jgi:hypothetical protein
LLWFIALTACVVHVWIAAVGASTEWGTRVLRALLGAFLWPLIIIALDSVWPSHRNQKRWLSVFSVTSVVLIALRYFAGNSAAREKTVEARNTVNDVAWLAVTAFHRDRVGAGRASVHRLCASGNAIPSRVPRGDAYTPSTDYQMGDEDTGWRCLSFKMGPPQRYQYTYIAGGPYKGPARGGPDPGPDGFEVAAEGDLDGNGITSLFTRTGKLDGKSGEIVVSPETFVDKELE